MQYAINQVYQFKHAPTDKHWLVVKQILRYLNGSLDHRIMSSIREFNLITYSNAYWARKPDDNGSITVFVIFLGDNLLS